jgi:hypothetical protein
MRPCSCGQIDVMGGVFLADGTEVKVVTGVDDHSRFCVLATVVRRASTRAVCTSVPNETAGDWCSARGSGVSARRASGPCEGLITHPVLICIRDHGYE